MSGVLKESEKKSGRGYGDWVLFQKKYLCNFQLCLSSHSGLTFKEKNLLSWKQILFLTLLHSEWPKQPRVLINLSAIKLKSRSILEKFVCCS